jgi:hypothetical protein
MRFAPWVGCLLLGVALGGFTWHGSEVAGVPALEARPFKWEYRAISEADLLALTDEKTVEAGLNKLGEDGWELVAVRNTWYAAAAASKDKLGVMYCLKRLRQGK